MLKKTGTKIMIGILATATFLLISYLLFNKFYPSLGADITEPRKALYEKSKQFKDGKFNNTDDVPKDLS